MSYGFFLKSGRCRNRTYGLVLIRNASSHGTNRPNECSTKPTHPPTEASEFGLLPDIRFCESSGLNYAPSFNIMMSKIITGKTHYGKAETKSKRLPIFIKHARINH